MNKRPTSIDVAKRAGVSQSTVSLVLSGNQRATFSDETRARVIAAAKELNYEPPLRKTRSVIGRRLLLLTPTLNNPFYAELVQTVEQYADSLGCHVLVCNTLRKPELERYYLHTLLHNHQVSGIIYTFLPSYPEMLEMETRTMPAVLIGEKRSDLPICSIELSNEQAGAILAEHLYGLGHRSFLFISTPFNQFSLARQQRVDGIRQFLRRHSLSDDCLEINVPDARTETDNLPGSVSYEYTVGRRLTAAALERGTKATALIGVNDMTAAGILAELKSHGCAVPGDFSVCGFDNVFPSVIAQPSLTTIDHHLSVRCSAAVDLVLSLERGMRMRSEQPAAPISKMEYAPRLIVRDSSGPAPSAGKGRGAC